MKSILEIDKDINSWYRTSKLPKFIKTPIAKSKRNKLKKQIHKFSDKVYGVKDIIQFLYYTMAHGSTSLGFLYLKSCRYDEDNDPNIIFSEFKYEDKDSGNIYEYMVNVFCKEVKIDIDIQITSKRGVSRFHITDMKSLEPKEEYNEIISFLIRALNSMIGEMMEILLNDMIKRSERIYEK